MHVVTSYRYYFFFWGGLKQYQNFFKNSNKTEISSGDESIYIYLLISDLTIKFSIF